MTDVRPEAVFIKEGVEGALNDTQVSQATNIADAVQAKSETDPLVVTQGTVLSSDFDSIDIAKMSNGGIVTAHSAITATATSTEIDCRGFNSVIIEVETTNVSSSDKTWTPTITGSCVSGGTFGQIFKDISGTQTALTLPTIAFGAGNVKQIYVIQGGIPSFLKITETLAGSNGTSAVTVKAVPFNV